MNQKQLEQDIRKEQMQMQPGEMRTKLVVKMPQCERCYQCAEEYKFKKVFEMYICSGLKMAEYGDCVIWKCPKCDRVKTEKVDAGDGGRFWYEANKMKIVQVET